MVKEINSEIIHTVISKKFGIIGHLVIDRLIGGSSFGGVRIVSDNSLQELQYVARSMTYKNAFIGNKIGGAKAAIIVKKENEKYRKDIIVEFGKSISPFVINRMYLPVMDMGIYLEELQMVYDSAGYKCDILSWRNLSHEYTAYSCFHATMCALKKKGILTKDTTVSIQGFGSVGSMYADLMDRVGARIVVISNKYCGLTSKDGSDGLDVSKLLIEKTKMGDDFILSQPKDMIVSHDLVLEKNVTVLLPASSAFAINDENVKRIKADIIICGANSPISYDVERLLFNNGKIVITDFVANCGGTFGSIIDNYVTKEIILYILATSYKRKVENLLSQSIDSNKSFADVAIESVEKRIDSDYEDIAPNGTFTKGILYLLSSPISYPIKNIMNDYMSKKYIAMYESLWR